MTLHSALLLRKTKYDTHTRRVSASFLTTMNSLVSRFASSNATQEIGLEGEEVPDAMWGSSGGFGNLGAAGALSFNIPAVPDVCVSIMLTNISASSLNIAAYLLPQITYRRPCRPLVQDQDSARYNDACFPIPRRSHRCRGFKSYRRKLHRYVMLC